MWDDNVARLRAFVAARPAAMRAELGSLLGLAEPVTVRFYRLLDCPFNEDVVLSLLWIGPDGTEIRARTEAVAARHFGTPGQVMYVRAPLADQHTQHGPLAMMANRLHRVEPTVQLAQARSGLVQLSPCFLELGFQLRLVLIVLGEAQTGDAQRNSKAGRASHDRSRGREGKRLQRRAT